MTIFGASGYTSTSNALSGAIRFGCPSTSDKWTETAANDLVFQRATGASCIASYSFAGTEAFVKGATGPGAGAYGCSIDNGTSFSWYSAYSLNASYGMTLCAWPNLAKNNYTAVVANTPDSAASSQIWIESFTFSPDLTGTADASVTMAMTSVSGYAQLPEESSSQESRSEEPNSTAFGPATDSVSASNVRTTSSSESSSASSLPGLPSTATMLAGPTEQRQGAPVSASATAFASGSTSFLTSASFGYAAGGVLLLVFVSLLVGWFSHSDASKEGENEYGTVLLLDHSDEEKNLPSRRCRTRCRRPSVARVGRQGRRMMGLITVQRLLKRDA